MTITIVTTLLVLLWTTVYVRSQPISVCTGQEDCDACIQASPLCSWCADPEFTGMDRCYLTSQSIMCNSTQNPQGTVTSQSNDALNDTNQISPRTVDVKARIGEPVSFTLQVRPARNFPLDVYLLMDLSASMANDLANLQSLGTQIAETIEAITPNFRLGFGSFVDKRVAPYVSTIPERLTVDPCRSMTCVPPFSYRHIVSLNPDNEAFNEGVSEQRISGNLDAPEGGFDGFIQSIVCSDLIGWRDNARHILVYITDAGFHYAGDGLLGGAVIPNVGECLMGTQMGSDALEYEFYDRIDYPSIGLIREKLREFDIIPIFAAEGSVTSFYDALAQELQEAEVGELSSNSDNIVTLLNDSYTRASQRINPVADRATGIDIIATPTSCPIINNNECDGVQIEQTAEFEVTVTVTECTEELLQGPQEVVIRPLGFGTATVRVSAICDCECTNVTVPDAPECTGGNGTLVCGTCSCNPERFGDRCECDRTGQVAGSNGNLDCPENTGQTCSGRGACICGECQCQGTFFGPACECDNFGCDRDSRGLICGGPDRGTCQCDGQCTCRTSSISGLLYTGAACDCSPDNITCIAPDEPGSLCRGRGECICGECICEGYDGIYCDTCINSTFCPSPLCNNARTCAMCAFGVIMSVEECMTCPNISVINSTELSPDAVVCDFIEETCEYRYYVTLDEEGRQTVQIDEDITCPLPSSSRVLIEPWIIAVIIIGALILFGIIVLVLIKVILMLLDHFEVKRFLNEVQDPKFRKNENPLFQSPNKKYDNPLYGN